MFHVRTSAYNIVLRPYIPATLLYQTVHNSGTPLEPPTLSVCVHTRVSYSTIQVAVVLLVLPGVSAIIWRERYVICRWTVCVSFTVSVSDRSLHLWIQCLSGLNLEDPQTTPFHTVSTPGVYGESSLSVRLLLFANAMQSACLKHVCRV